LGSGFDFCLSRYLFVRKELLAVKELFITGLTVILGAIVLYMGIYLFSHKNRSIFGLYHPQKNKGLQKVVICWAYILTILGSLTIISAFASLLLFQVIMLVLDAFSACILSFFMVAYSR